jgi:hypothetical protein
MRECHEDKSFFGGGSRGAGSFTSREKEALSTGWVGRKKHLAPAG